MSKIVLPLVSCFLISLGCIGQRLPVSRDTAVQRLGSNFVSQKEAIALSIGIVHRGQLYSYNFGATKPGSTESPTSQSVYQVGSITKSFVSLLLAKAVSGKKIALDDDVRKYLEGSYPDLEFDGQPIRVINLVNLTSGLPDNLLPASVTSIVDSDSSATQTERALGGLSREDFFKLLKSVKLDTVPGYHPKHSNTGAQLLGYIIEKVYGAPVEKLVKQHILDPLKMNNTSFGVEKNEKQLLAGYDGRGKVAPWFTNSYSSSVGGIRSSVEDMSKYVSYLMQKKTVETEMVMKKTILIDASTNKVVGMNPVDKIDPTRYSVSFNWYHYSPEEGKSQVWSDGGTPGFSCYVIMYPELELGVILMANKGGEKVFYGLGGLAGEVRGVFR